MATYLSPGVYIEEIPSGSKPIEGVATSTAAFVGRAQRGPTGEAVLIHSLDDYKATFGEIAAEDDAMGLAVRAFYMNGGKDAYICRLVSDDPPTDAASVSVDGEVASDVFAIEAGSVGAWGNDLYVRVVKPDPDALTFDLEVGHQEKGAFVVDEIFSGLTMDARDDDYVLTQVNGVSKYVEVSLKSAAEPDTGDYQDAILTGGIISSEAAYFKASMADVARMTLDINGLGAKQITLNKAALDLTESNVGDGGKIAGAIEAAVKSLGIDDAYQDFTCAYTSDRFVLTSPRSQSSASVVVYDGDGSKSDLAALLRLTSETRAVLQGESLTSLANDLFSTRVSGTMPLCLNIDGRGAITLQIDTDALDLAGTSHSDDGQALARAIRDAVRALSSKIPSYKDFDCAYQVDGDGQFILTSGASLAKTSSITVEDIAAGDKGALARLICLDADTKLIQGREYQASPARVIPKQSLGLLDEGVQLEGGGEARPKASDYNAFFGNVLRKVRDVSILHLPGEQWAADGSGNAIISEAVAHCEATKSRMVLIDPPAGKELEQRADVDQMALPTSTYTVLYYPWVKVANPLYDEDTNPLASRTVKVAPSAFAAGLWARTDGNRGVWKAPAGVETQLTGVAGLAYIVEEGEQDQLNPLGVNAIRKLPSFGSVIWGSRTLATKAKPEWRYVPVRRTAIFIERSIYEGIQWAVFEPNDHPLWSSLRANIESFMSGLFRAGAFQGAKASDAFFVRCGLGDTMTQADIDRGQVIVIVGFAPLKPAEFVIVRIQQKVGQQ